MATQVTITTTERNLRATILRARITDLLATTKCGSVEEKRDALIRFERAVDKFKTAL